MSNRKTQLISFVLLFITLDFTVYAADKQSINLSTIGEPNQSLYVTWLHLIYTHAFDRLNIDVTYTALPAIRASKMADLGRVDGEVARVADYGTEHPNLVRIEESLFVANISAFTANPSIKINSWEDINNSKYNIEYYRGSLLAHQRLTQYVSPDRLSNSSSPSESLRKLLRGRIDIYIDTEQVPISLLTTPEFANTGINMLVRLENMNIHGYLYKTHKELAVKLADVFQKMKSEGLFQIYFTQARESMDSTSQ
ncbi:hypothetical protein HQQ94_03550 [Shewanella sp. VB17]|uniref:hypothetical protein n=1 Tax=Shewanella sp. VB17 TaxID=2739432 RepID=UPI00156507A6|nr:hypothetical protein [Shewanella sp. VB17]NRD72331.1 hypothetical protein [Shewanella sp. VB17]